MYVGFSQLLFVCYKCFDVSDDAVYFWDLIAADFCFSVVAVNGDFSGCLFCDTVDLVLKSESSCLRVMWPEWGS